MSLTGTDIEQVFYNFLKGGSLETAISGKIYKSGMRPIGSTNEDVVIVFLSGFSTQIQDGIVVINTYVADTKDGLKNTSRIKSLETVIKTWIDSFVDVNYKIELERTIKVFAEPDISQHFISTRISFKTLIQ